MLDSIRPLLVCLLGLAFYACNLASLAADEGQPVAVRYWPHGGVTIETMWDLHVGLALSPRAQQSLPQPVDQNVSLTVGEPPHVLDRMPEQPKVQWLPSQDVASPSSNAVSVSVVPLQSSGDADGAADAAVTIVAVDGLRIVDATKVSAAVLAGLLSGNVASVDGLQSIDVLLLGDAQAVEADLQSIARSLTPRIVVMPATVASDTVGEHTVTKVAHNTLAVSSSDEQTETGWVSLATVPWKMSEPLASLFAAKEAASKDSRATFAALSAEQMSFEPSNGTHTPRWNAEHMMGRELLFFSQIYHAQDESIPEMDLNPQQMPKDYRAAHPNWTGAEEARQMQRVESFTRRFAYLLDGLELDERAPGSRHWTPRSLLEQMQRHYGEHTANVRKKMLLPEWPQVRQPVQADKSP